MEREKPHKINSIAFRAGCLLHKIPHFLLHRLIFLKLSSEAFSNHFKIGLSRPKTGLGDTAKMDLRAPVAYSNVASLPNCAYF